MSVGLVMAGAVLTAVTAATALVDRRERARVREEIEGHAAAVRGSLVETELHPTIAVRRGGAVVSVALGGGRSGTITASAPWLLAPGAPIAIRAQRARDLDPGGDRVLLEPAIDRAWLVRGPREVLESVLDRPTRDAMLAIGPTLAVRGCRDRLWLECGRPVGARARRERVVHLVAIATRFAGLGVDRLRALAARIEGRLRPGPEGGPGGGAPEIELGSAAGPVRLRMRGGIGGLVDGAPRWEAHLELPRDAPRYRGRVGIEGGLEPAPPAGLLGPRGASSVAAAGVFVLLVQGRRASLAWTDHVDDDAIRAGVELLASIGRGQSAGAFR